MLVEGQVFIGRDNAVELELSLNNILIDHSTITRVVLDSTDNVLDSNDTPEVFDWVSAERLSLKVGLSSLTVGKYRFRLIIYLPGYTNGLVWGEVLITVNL